jgi:sugar phosphate isomerase/epimerase
MRVIFIGTNWGVEEPTLEKTLLKLRSAGFDGVEMGAPVDPAARAQLRAALADAGLALVAQQWTAGATAADHARSFEDQYRRNAELKPLLVNSHTGKDWFTLEENLVIFRRAKELEGEVGIPIAHETHRGRALFSMRTTSEILDALPTVHLTADFSHWCCVHESYLEDQGATLDRAVRRSIHIHARVGQPEAPQVTDPRAPEWKEAVETHLRWWQRIVDHQRTAGREFLTICPEFGPPLYMPTLPHTQKPVAELWEVDKYMRQLLKERIAA